MAVQPTRAQPTSAILTFMIADVRGYTAFTRTAGDEAAARLAAGFAEVVREGVEAFGGNVIELRGDEALAVFGSARSAIRAAVDLQRIFRDESAIDPALPMNVGIGLDAGEAVPVEDGYRGAALNLAARLCSAAGQGEILASEGVIHLAGTLDNLALRPREGLALKGVGESVRALEVVVPDQFGTLWTTGVPADLPPDLDPLAPLLGRDHEARWLRWAWRSSRRRSVGCRVLVGPVGSGKTRLAAEAAAIAAREGAVIVYAGGPHSESDLDVALRGRSEDLADPACPLLLVIDDLDRAGVEAPDVLDRLATAIAGRPGLILITATDDPSAAMERVLRRIVPESETRYLGPLDVDAVGAILRMYLPDTDKPLPIQAVLEASDGLPIRIHALASEWAQGEVARRLGGATSRAAASRHDLRRLEADVAANLIDLQLARERFRLLGSGGDDVRTDDTCPFMGLASFDVDDDDVFFGRERLVAEMIGRLAGGSFLGVVGPSGSGKSSAVRAGLVPAIEAGALPGVERWVRVLLRPGDEPMRELDRVVFAAVDEDLRPALARTKDPIEAAIGVLPEGARLLVVVDQFEELFTTTSDPAARTAFIDALVSGAGSGRATVIVAVRADFYGRCAEHDALAGLLAASHVLVAPMNADEYRRAIDGPAQRSGLRVEPVLVDQLVADVLDQPGGLPLLSTALVELWQQRTGRWIRLVAYAGSGGVSGAVARLAETSYGSLTEAEQGIARSIFLRLASGDRDRAVRRRVPLAELDATTNAEVRQTLTVLTEARLVTVDEGSVEVAHEALLREWPRLVGWIEEDQEGRRLRQHLADASREWAAAGRETSELYRGGRLASALDWTADHNLELNQLERQFVTESRTASERDARRQARTNRRLRGLLVVAAIGLIVAVSAGGVAFVQKGAADRATQEAVAQRAQAEQAAIAADAQRLGAQALGTKDLDLSLLLARQAVALDDSPVTQANLLADLERSPAATHIYRPLPGRLLSVYANSDGSSLLVANNAGAVAVIDAASGATRFVHQLQAREFAELTSAGRIVVLSGHAPVTLTELDPMTGAVIGTIAYPSEVTEDSSLDWAPDLSSIASTSPDRRSVTVWDAKTLKALRTVAAPKGTVFLNVIMRADGHHLLTPLVDEPLPKDLGAAFDGPGRLAWWLPTGTAPVVTYPVPNVGNDAIAISPDFATMSVDNVPEDGKETLVDLKTGAGRTVQGQHTAGIRGSIFSPDGKTLVTAGDDRVARVWDVGSGALRQTLEGHNGRVFGPAVTRQGSSLTAWTVSLDGSLMAWDLSGDRSAGRPFPAGKGVDAGTAPIFNATAHLALSPDGHLIAVGQNGGLAIFDASTHQLVRELTTSATDAAPDVKWSPDGSRLALTGDGADSVELFDTTTWRSVRGPLPGPAADRPAAPGEPPVGPTETGRRPNAAQAIAFSADSRLLAAGTDDGKLYTWDAHSGAPVGSPIDVGGSVFGVSFDPRNGWIAAAWNSGQATDGPHSGNASVFAPGDSSPRYTVDVDGDYGHADVVSFSPDGSLLATGGGTGDVRLWDATTGAPIGRHTQVSAGWVLTIDWSPSGAMLVTGGTDGTIRLVDVASGSSRGTFTRLPNEASGAVFSPDGQQVLVAYANGQGYDWSIDPATWATRACSIAGRTLTHAEWDAFLPGRSYAPACGG